MSTKIISIRIDENLLSKISNRASLENRSVSNMITHILMSSLSQEEICSICAHNTDAPVGCAVSALAYSMQEPNEKCKLFQRAN